MKIEASDANDYVAAIPEGRRPHVEAVRKLVRRVVPQSVERLELGMIRFAYAGKAFAAVESDQGSLSLHLLELSARPELMTKYEAGLAGLDMGKGCIRFQEVDELPIDVIADILRETGVGASAKKAKSAKKPAKKVAKAPATKKKAPKKTAAKPKAKATTKPKAKTKKAARRR